MGKRALSVAFVILGMVALACGGGSDDPSKSVSSALYGGTAVPNAAQVGVVWLEHVVDPFDPVGCWRGTGVLLTNDTILTAGHVADYGLALQKCATAGLVPKYLRITMPDPSLPSGSQVSVISCGVSSLPPDKWKEGCGAKFVAAYKTPPSGTASLFTRGEDAALIQVVSGYVVNGIGAFYSRHLSAATTPSFYNTQVTCYGMSDSAPIAPFTTGALRKADFTVLQYPHPDAVASPTLQKLIPLIRTDTMFAVSRGGGVTPTGETDPSGNYYQIPVEGDSGGPCIKHTTGVDGDIVGIDQSGEQVSAPSSPSWAHYTATTASNANLRSMVRAGLGVQAGQVFADLDFGGVPDDSVEVQVSPTNTIQVVVRFDNGATTLPPFDTLIPASAARFAGTYFGDFDANGFADIVASIGNAAAALPLYFNGATASGFAFTTVPTWQPGAPYEYLTVGRFNDDAVDDVAAARFDGSEDVFLGEPGVGLTVPAQYVPRGFNWYGPPDQESIAIAAPGLVPQCQSAGTPCSTEADCCVGGFGASCVANQCQFVNLVNQQGNVYLLTNAGATLESNLLDLDSVKGASPGPLSPVYGSVAGDLFGTALAWGKFDKAQIGDTLVIGGPGVTVGGAASGGMVALFSYDANSSTLAKVAELDRPTLGAPPDSGFGSKLTTGDFNGDGQDDLVIASVHDLSVLYGAPGGIPGSQTATIITAGQLGQTVATINGALDSGDFNCDGYEDLAVGAPIEPGATQPAAGAVIVLYGGAAGLSAQLRQRLDKTVPGLDTLPPQSGDEGFGSELAAGNFNGDGYVGRPCVDLAISVGEGTGSIRNGAVYIVYGSPDGLKGQGSQHLSQGETLADGTKISDVSEPGDGFGEFMAITRADLDRYDDLIIGAFNENMNAGAAHVLRGSAAGITAAGQAFWQQGQGGIPGVQQTGPNPLSAGSKFGWTVGGTSNGLIVVAASWESFDNPTINQAGWAALIRVDDAVAQGSSPQIQAGQTFEATENILTQGIIPPRQDGFFGRMMTKSRPAFVPVTQPPDRYAGNLVLTGASRLDCTLDITPPTLSAVSISPACLWTPNHKFERYELGSDIGYAVADHCDPNPTVRIISVITNEPDAGDTEFQFNDGRVCLRAERNGDGSGRTYTITMEARDAAGNSSTATVTVVVPKSKTPGCSASTRLFSTASDCIQP